MWGDHVSLCGEAVHNINPPKQRGLITGYQTQVHGLAGCDRGGMLYLSMLRAKREVSQLVGEDRGLTSNLVSVYCKI
jgi:hypothetical protein